MTDKLEDIVDNLKQTSHWVRVPFMLVYGFVLYLFFVPVVIVMMTAQIIFALITGESNRNLRGLGSVVQQYVSQIIDYITYNSNERPFPFSDFPEEDLSVVEKYARKNQESSAQPEDSDSRPKTVKKAKKPADKTSAASGETSSTTRKPAKKKAPAKKKISVAPSKSIDAGLASAEAESSGEGVESTSS
jgi:hypothetical protein|tara:strand:+ start:488 stop:1054 length:567 start_codon:yes stop_codon:yes gene_type:complete